LDVKTGHLQAPMDIFIVVTIAAPD